MREHLCNRAITAISLTLHQVHPREKKEQNLPWLRHDDGLGRVVSVSWIHTVFCDMA